jgi:two-component system NarL family response regulator
MTLCIVEDDRRLVENLRSLLAAELDVEVLSAHGTAEDAFDDAPWAGTDVLLVDLDLPAMSGIDLIRKIHPLYPNLSILVYTIHEDRASVMDAIRAGACGYLIKGSAPRELIIALREIYAGGAPMSPKIARAVLGELRMDDVVPLPDDQRLTARETAILKMLEEGFSYKEIAVDQGVSVHTVHTHIKNAYRKLQAHSRSEAIRIGRVRGVL